MKGGEKNMNQSNLDSWDGFLGSAFLKAEDVDNEDQIFVCKNVELDAENQRPLLVLENNGHTTKFSLNVTNATFVKNSEIKTPKDLVGKKIQFKFVKAFSPSAKKEVDSLRIYKIE